MINYSFISFILLFFGLSGLLLPKNILFIIICIELILISINYLFLLASISLDTIVGYYYSLLILVIAAVESSIGLSILILYYRFHQTILLQFINSLKG